MQTPPDSSRSRSEAGAAAGVMAPSERITDWVDVRSPEQVIASLHPVLTWTRVPDASWLFARDWANQLPGVAPGWPVEAGRPKDPISEGAAAGQRSTYVDDPWVPVRTSTVSDSSQAPLANNAGRPIPSTPVRSRRLTRGAVLSPFAPANSPSHTSASLLVIDNPVSILD
ncbi:uncharacterized protein THITE_2085038 [Thermothielavioides terrestris NRRL 8126]|uniref:Uncharacterized protein n=1 Tax=Thermothielavioides terrestris (strain ATCC 38088 / NRRL 8126) TaxID=578455 RepID=G2QSZ5_THETT|nr:uncharacterized protein THITE_2085038 [Thermothielavioides terrestris NRRL 8126]AEO63520.1 hypothetical protein THITE_2085038 [Thermothielavioides terrestris NRRL 8126]